MGKPSMNEVITTSGERLRIGANGILDSNSVRSDSVNLEQVRQCNLWFDRAEPTPESGVNSFWLLHVIQHWAGSPISHGAVILAAFQKGFPIVRQADETGANVMIGVATDCIDEFDCGCGHP